MEECVSSRRQSLTPSQFANRQASARNAWRFVWLRLPGDDYWIRADQFRTRLEQTQQQRSMSMEALS